MEFIEKDNNTNNLPTPMTTTPIKTQTQSQNAQTARIFVRLPNLFLRL